MLPHHMLLAFRHTGPIDCTLYQVFINNKISYSSMIPVAVTFIEHSTSRCVIGFRVKSRSIVKACGLPINTHLTSQKQNPISPFAIFKKNNSNLTIDLLSLGVYAPGVKFWPTDPKFCGKFESELKRARPDLKHSVVLGSEGDNSPFRGARPKPTSYSDSPYPKHH